MKHLLQILKENKAIISCYIVLGIISCFLTNYSAVYFQTLIDSYGDGSLTFGIIAVYAVILIVLCITNYIDIYADKKLEHGIYLELKLKALEKLSRIDYRAYLGLKTGKLIQQLENGSIAGREILHQYVLRLVREIIPSVIFSMIFIFSINTVIMLTILGGYILIFITAYFLLKALYKIKERILINEEKMNHFLVRGFMEMAVFRLNNRFGHEIRKARKAKDEIVISKVKMKFIHEAFFTVFFLFQIIVKIAIILYGWLTGAMSIGEVVALTVLVDNAYAPIAVFNVIFVQYKLDKVAYTRLSDFFDLPDDKKLENGKAVDDVNGAIDIEHLKFMYDSRVIFDDLSLSIKKGEKVAFVGMSGSGKSTIVKLLAGLLKPDGGRIIVDRQDLSELMLNSYYSGIAYISQEAPVFDGTLRENITFDMAADDNMIIEVLNKVELSELYSKLDNGLDTEIGERGIMLSGGERQRLALARLWFSNAGMVIIDEATSALDNITEENVMSCVLELLRNKTLIVIAHRLKTIKNFEKIIVFKDGQIVGQGNFSSLLEENTYFYELYYTASDKQREYMDI